MARWISAHLSKGLYADRSRGGEPRHFGSAGVLAADDAGAVQLECYDQHVHTHAPGWRAPRTYVLKRALSETATRWCS